MKILFEKQKSRGGIIDLNEKDQIISISVIFLFKKNKTAHFDKKINKRIQADKIRNKMLNQI
jgi:hypothetical protein